jgi:hypothetical protein
VLGKGDGDGGVANGRLLVQFADAFLARDEAVLAPVRRTVAETLGDAAMVDSAAVVAAYEGLDRVADSMGIPIDEERIEPTEGLRKKLGVNDFASAANTKLP